MRLVKKNTQESKTRVSTEKDQTELYDDGSQAVYPPPPPKDSCDDER